MRSLSARLTIRDYETQWRGQRRGMNQEQRCDISTPPCQADPPIWGDVKSDPQRIISHATNWRFLEELRHELKT
jgi:hypothetical protein